MAHDDLVSGFLNYSYAPELGNPFRFVISVDAKSHNYALPFQLAAHVEDMAQLWQSPVLF